MSFEDLYDFKEMRRAQSAEGVSLFVAILGDSVAQLLRLAPEKRDETTLAFLLSGAYKTQAERESVADPVRDVVQGLLQRFAQRLDDYPEPPEASG